MTMFPLGRPARTTIAALGALYTGAVLWVTLRPLPWATEGNQEAYGILNLQSWIGWSTWTEGSPLEIVANILMFLPIGLASGLLFRGSVGLLVPIALTLVIELAQIPLADRISHPRDLVANASGAILGLLIAAAVRRRRRAGLSRR
ncbi:VanZ family protein [Microbacterium sp. C448]|uniref:VanZ family protein n=1 Tax=Microbacterium sp. C448 TaxID=1177594 RepID=UPI0004AF73FF|nr:VanZ family protein [Microbacterium sp. C448]